MAELRFTMHLPQPMTAEQFLRRHKGVSHRMLVRLKRLPPGICRNDSQIRPIAMVQFGDETVLTDCEVPSALAPSAAAVPVLGETDSYIVYNKPAGMPVHPSQGHHGDTLGNVFAAQFPQLPFRPVYRLDSDTSGICLIAKSAYAAGQLQGSTRKTYLALVCGELSTGGTVDAPIGRAEGSVLCRCVRPEVIASNQTKDDFCILNYEDEELRKFAPKCPATVVFFSSVQKLEEGIFLDGENIVWKSKTEEFVFARTDELKLLGRHNHENVMAASAMAYCAGVPKETIRKVIMRFTAVPHRIEFVEEINGVAYYNDSKGTNPDAAIKGIQAMNRPTLLIGGGYDKQSSYEEWIQAFDGKVKQLVLIGQTREKIEKTAHECGFFNTILAENLEEAVKICAEKAEAGDAVLLSPACASWGQFDNYEQRGDKFKEYVRAML